MNLNKYNNFIFYISIALIAFIFTSGVPFPDIDLWTRLTVGSFLFQTGSILNKDIFSYVPTNPVYYDHEWGAGAIFYFFAKNFGYAGIFLLKVIMLFLIFFLISRIIKLQNKNTNLNLIFFFLAGYSIFMIIGAVTRSLLFTYLFFTFWIYLLEKIRKGNGEIKASLFNALNCMPQKFVDIFNNKSFKPFLLLINNKTENPILLNKKSYLLFNLDMEQDSAVKSLQINKLKLWFKNKVRWLLSKSNEELFLNYINDNLIKISSNDTDKSNENFEEKSDSTNNQFKILDLETKNKNLIIPEKSNAMIIIFLDNADYRRIQSGNNPLKPMLDFAVLPKIKNN